MVPPLGFAAGLRGTASRLGSAAGGLRGTALRLVRAAIPGATGTTGRAQGSACPPRLGFTGGLAYDDWIGRQVGHKAGLLLVVTDDGLRQTGRDPQHRQTFREERDEKCQ
jgi:hypothetical protein